MCSQGPFIKRIDPEFETVECWNSLSVNTFRTSTMTTTKAGLSGTRIQTLVWY